MKSRCLSEKSRQYHNYGGRGIKVCDRWMSFIGFLEDMGIRPDGHSIDRIDPNGNYEPSNCRWATRTEQMNNRTVSKFLVIDGVKKTVADWARVDGAAPMEAIRSRLKYGWTPSEAVFKPLQIIRRTKSA
jgi:hypothetical protein